MPITALPTPPSRSDPTNFAARGDAFLAALPTFVDEANALAIALNLNSTTDVSASSVVIGTGAKTFAVTAGKSFQPGMYLVIADTAAPSTNSMWGQVTSYSGTALVVSIIAVRGSGTKTAWVISQSAAGNAAAGANADITSLSALTTALSIAQGGTGATTANAAADALGAYRKGTLKGTVSQSAGVPTGAVVERGSNANGEYVRFADGTQICTHSRLVNAVTAAGAAITVAYTKPAVFVGESFASYIVVFYTGGGFTGAKLYALPFAVAGELGLALNTGVSAAEAAPRSTSLGTYAAGCHYIAITEIGRWY